MKRLKMDCFSTLLAAALLVTATSAQAAVHRVYEGDSIQAVIDIAAPGDTILVEPGLYKEMDNGRYGLRISTDNLRLIGKVKKGKGKAGKVRLMANEEQKTGILAAPKGCEYDMNEGECKVALELSEDESIPYVKDFYIRGFSVEEFPVNGIQTRWVDGFEFVRNESANNLNNGIYPTLSANGLVRNNESYGSLDTAMWVAGSENVRVMGNELHSSVIGFEITVSNDVQVTHNEIYNNTVGVGLFHPNGAGNPPLDVMANWVIEHNDIYNNNLSPNPAPPGSFQADLPPGAGILALGVSDHVISKNNVEDHDFVGIAVLGWCTSVFGTGRDCQAPEDPLAPKGLNGSYNNLVAHNYLSGNGKGDSPPVGLEILAGDIAYFHIADINPPFAFYEASGTGNCFKKNKPKSFSFFTSQPDTELPTDGC
ncbi:MAG: right-handed parallel beta-helix repeat-containing protein [Halioglobus sp.]